MNFGQQYWLCNLYIKIVQLNISSFCSITKDNTPLTSMGAGAEGNRPQSHLFSNWVG